MIASNQYNNHNNLKKKLQLLFQINLLHRAFKSVTCILSFYKLLKDAINVLI